MAILKRLLPNLLGILLPLTSLPLYTEHVDPLNHYDQKLLAQENYCWKRFEAIGIYRNSIQVPYLKEAQNYQTIFDSPKIDLPQETLTLIYRVMNDFGINPRSISIVGSNNPFAITARDFAIFINKEYFFRYSTKAQLFLVAHEMQHIIYKDNSFCHFLTNAVKNGKLNEIRHDGALYTYLRFTELRADVKAAIFSKEYAQGYVAFIEELLALEGDTDGITHPKNSERLNLGREILAAF
ncbi:MAG TPA: hypothetical protein VHO47_03115 [Candidatus Babeliales bacterium]|nr:hypothetical protein [Candidatus Babeliales bacterium]